MARKKQLNPMATALTLAALGVTGFVIYKFIIKPRIDRKKDIAINLIHRAAKFGYFRCRI
jgi:hypothetical protein